MKEFIDYILRFGNLNQQQLNLVVSRATELNLAKDEYFSEAGKIARQAGFIMEGVIRVCYYNNKGEEITRYFIDEVNIVMDSRSFEYNMASSEYLQAVTDCRLIVFSKEAWLELFDTIVGWDKLAHKIISNALIQKLERISLLVSEDATTRYTTFLEKFPKLANRIPLSYLASYLGITQSSLSRIRKNIC